MKRSTILSLVVVPLCFSALIGKGTLFQKSTSRPASISPDAAVTNALNNFQDSLNDILSYHFMNIKESWEKGVRIRLAPAIEETTNSIFDQYSGLAHIGQLRSMETYGGRIQTTGIGIVNNIEKKLKGYLGLSVKRDQRSLLDLLATIRINMMNTYQTLVNTLQDITGQKYTTFAISNAGFIVPQSWFEKVARELDKQLQRMLKKSKDKKEQFEPVFNGWVAQFKYTALFAKHDKDIRKKADDLKKSTEQKAQTLIELS